jgi:hypothetical protein
MQKGQKTSTAELKREAVQLAQTSGKSIAQVAGELGISDILCWLLLLKIVLEAIKQMSKSSFHPHG